MGKRILIAVVSSFVAVGSVFSFNDVNTNVYAAETSDVQSQTEVSEIEEPYEKLSLKNAEMDFSEIMLGGAVKITSNIVGGTGEYKYTYSFRKINVNEFTVVYEDIDNDTAEITVPDVGSYVVKVSATDSDGNYDEKTFDLIVKNDTGEKLANNSFVNSTEIYAGNKIKAAAVASGGVESYSFKFYYKKGNGKWITVKDYSESKSADIFFSTSGFYTVRIAVKDADGNYIPRDIKITVKKETGSVLKNNSSISSLSAPIGKSVELSANVSGGTKPYQYKYYYKENGGNWKVIKDYCEDSKISASFSESSFYVVRIAVKDADGNYIPKDISFTATKDTGTELKNNSTVSSSIVFEGDRVTLRANVSGGAFPYKYKYYYKGSDGKWITIKDYSRSSSASVQLPSAGVYTVRIAVSDGNGKYIPKDYTVNAAEKNSMKVVNSSLMMNNPKWATSNTGTIPSGTTVYPITKSGNWFKVKCGNKAGWLYNLSFGSYKNYTSINASSLPYIADDIIFNRGKSVYSLFKYVTSMRYNSINNDTLENLCTYILRYKQGACYHRAALLYYILNRAGYEVIRVDDGIDDYTGGGPHNWCIIKTAEGYRHIDPTHVIGLPDFYLVKDSAISNYFTWDRNKYPECK